MENICFGNLIFSLKLSELTSKIERSDFMDNCFMFLFLKELSSFLLSHSAIFKASMTVVLPEKK